MNTHEAITRNCSICGLAKPLSAFLQITESQGTQYGTICASCRGAGLAERKKSFREEEKGSTSSGIRIGAKERLEIEKKRRQELRVAQESMLEEVKKRNELLDEKTASNLNEQIEKERRQQIITDKQKQAKATKVPPGQLFVNTTSPASTTNYTELQNEEKSKLEHFFLEEQRSTTIDLSGAPILDRQNAEISRHNPIFNQFKSWLGNAAITRTEQLQQQKTHQQKSHLQKDTQKDPLTEYIDKTWGPSRKR